METNVYILGEGHLAKAARDLLTLHRVKQVDITEANIVWCCINMEVDDSDKSYVEEFYGALGYGIEKAITGSTIVISTQVPFGTIAFLEKAYPHFHFVSMPENIRRASAYQDMVEAPYLVVGCRANDPITTFCMDSFCIAVMKSPIFLTPEEAELYKHTLNAFLAMEIVFANEIDDICKRQGVDSTKIMYAVRKDRRVGTGPLNPGGAYRGGTLGRDVYTLTKMHPGPLIKAIRMSNLTRLAKESHAD